MEITMARYKKLTKENILEIYKGIISNLIGIGAITSFLPNREKERMERIMEREMERAERMRDRNNRRLIWSGGSYTFLENIMAT